MSLTAYLLLQYSVRERDAALAVSDGPLLNVLPRSIADRLKHAPGVIADRHDDVTVLFADIADFTPFTERTSPERVVGVLDGVFSSLDELTRRLGLEKIKTIGDVVLCRSCNSSSAMNRVLLTGRLTRDPELRTTAGGKAVAQFSIASHEFVAGKEKPEFHCRGQVYPLPPTWKRPLRDRAPARGVGIGVARAQRLMGVFTTNPVAEPGARPRVAAPLA